MAVASRVRHFVSLGDLDPGQLTNLLDLATTLKAERARREPYLRDRTLAQIFEKPSLRTRLSFDVGMAELGGHCIYLSPQEVGLGLGAQAGEERLRKVAREAGFSNLRRAAHTPVNLILELTP